MGGGASSKPGGKHAPSLVSAFESIYAEVTVNTASVIIKAKQHLHKIELVKFKNTFDDNLKHLEKLGESVPVLVNQLGTDVYRGDTVKINLAQEISDILAYAGVYNGFEMHVMLCPANALPERVVIGSQSHDNTQFSIRHDTPREVAVMTKAMIPEKVPTVFDRFTQMQKLDVDLGEKEHSIPESRRLRKSFSETPSEASTLDTDRSSLASTDPTSTSCLSTVTRPLRHRGAACAVQNWSPHSSPPMSVDGDSVTSVDEQSSRSGASGHSQKGVARRRKKIAPSEQPHSKAKGKDIDWGPDACMVGGGSPRSLDAGRRLRSSSCGAVGAARPRRNSWSGVTSSKTHLPPLCELRPAQLVEAGSQSVINKRLR